jgi:hypothetical protein
MNGRIMDPPPSLPPIRPPGATREEMGFPRQRLYTNFVAFEETIALALSFEMNAKLRVNDIADHEEPSVAHPEERWPMFHRNFRLERKCRAVRLYPRP